jgi:cation transporter-like permease
LTFLLFIAIPVISILFNLAISIPTSTFLNYIAFQFGLNVNNVVNPVMTAIDDFFSVFTFYLTLLLLGVP